MTKKEFYRFIEQGSLQGACRYFEYWFVYNSVPKSGKLLDLGCGMSMLPKALMEKGLQVVAVEIDPKAVDFQKGLGINAIKIKDEKLPFNDESFDIVTAVSAIEHFEDDGTTVAEILRVLKPGGLFIVTLPVGLKHVKNRFAGKNHPLTRNYSEKTYYEKFIGNDFAEINRELYKVTATKPKDYIPHKAWGTRINAEKVNKIEEDTGLCALLAKL